ncbi:MAG TPA: ATP-dependent Clp protease proteolytic subunit [Mycobacteriales bacterium]|nr:ATP-dependent Clp protease proteolytic subunit [Mycobacteriales bacterium]
MTVAGRWPPEFPDPPRRPPIIPPAWPAPEPPPAPPAPPARPLPTFPQVVELPRAGDTVEERLLERGIVLLSGQLDQPAAQRAAAQLMLLDAEWNGPVQLHLNCPDGELDAALVLAETVDLVHLETRAVASGVVGGPALGVLAAADRRQGHRHALFRLREPTGRASGRADRLAADVAEHTRQVAHLHERLASATGRPVEEVAADLRAGRVLTAEQAVDYGLLHEVVPTPR